jgi:hypothetical protein
VRLPTIQTVGCGPNEKIKRAMTNATKTLMVDSLGRVMTRLIEMKNKIQTANEM